MTAFDLMFEVRAPQGAPEGEQAFFVPGMLPPDADSEEDEAGGGPSCLFVCCAKDGASPFEHKHGCKQHSMPTLLRRAWRPAAENAETAEIAAVPPSQIPVADYPASKTYPSSQFSIIPVQAYRHRRKG